MKIRFLDNIKIKNKLLIIYVFCVLVPVFITNISVYKSIKNNAIQEQENRLYNTLERVIYNLNSTLKTAVSISNYLYTDRTLDSFLSREYEDPIEYYSEYNRLRQNNVIRYYNTAPNIFNIEIYTDNETITNGSYFIDIKGIEGEAWYNHFIESDKPIVLYSYYNKDKKYMPFLGPGRTISIIRKLDHYNKAGITKVLKIDLDYTTILSDILNQSNDQDIYISEGDKILFSSKESDHGYLPFENIDQLKLKEVNVEGVFLAISEKWNIYITESKISISLKLVENKILWGLLIVGNLVLPTFIIYIVKNSFKNRISLIETYLRKIKKEEFEYIEEYEGKDEIGSLIRSYNLMVIKIKDLIEVVFKDNIEKQALEISKKQAELNALQSQVNPHFLFNTLESIRMRGLIKGEEETANIIGELAVLLRNFIKWDKDFISIHEEMKFVESYLKIQEYRFGDRLSYCFQVEARCLEEKIPKFTIVTFVENACVHGIEEKIEGGRITITISSNDEKVYIDILDNGKGMDEKKLEEINQKIEQASIEMLGGGNNIGILNAYIRLKMYYNDAIQCEIDSNELEGTDICLILPSNDERGEKGC